MKTLATASDHLLLWNLNNNGIDSNSKPVSQELPSAQGTILDLASSFDGIVIYFVFFVSFPI